MIPQGTALRRIARNVTNIASAEAFYRNALGFETSKPAAPDQALATLLSVDRVITLRMRLGAQEIELSACHPAGLPYPPHSQANDLWFQHIAIVTHDIAQAHARLIAYGATAISNHGPQTLPASSGGVTAFKCRDPDGHPLELLAFPPAATKPYWQQNTGLTLGFDHSAISISLLERSQKFYASLGLSRSSQQVNTGAAQDHLDGLDGVTVDVAAMQCPQHPTPHLELLCYRQPPGRAATVQPNDIAAGRLVFLPAHTRLQLLRDPDGHVVMLDGRA
jgi:catechol 2,3-dioxygenase-like lactoylglutathione lyase family enzyme